MQLMPAHLDSQCMWYYHDDSVQWCTEFVCLGYNWSSHYTASSAGCDCSRVGRTGNYGTLHDCWKSWIQSGQYCVCVLLQYSDLWVTVAHFP